MRGYETRQILLKLTALLARKDLLSRRLKDEPVDLLFVHGSVAKGKTTALSDLDLAVQFTGSYGYSDVARIVDRLETDFQTHTLDLAVLNSASPLLAMQVLTNGVCLFERAGSLVRFRYRTITRYLATKHLRTQFNRYLDTAIRG